MTSHITSHDIAHGSGDDDACTGLRQLCWGKAGVRQANLVANRLNRVAQCKTKHVRHGVAKGRGRLQHVA